MEVQKHLFKIAERVNTTPSADVCWKIIYNICAILSVIFLFLFALGELYVDHNYNDFQTCLKQTNFTMRNDEVAFIYENKGQISRLISKTYNGKDDAGKSQNLPNIESVILKSTQKCTIYKNLNITQMNTDYFQSNSLQFSYGKAITNMDKHSREILKVDNYTMVFNQLPNQFIRTLFGFYSMVCREMVSLKDEGQINMLVSYGPSNNPQITNQFRLYAKAYSSYIVSGYQGISQRESLQLQTIPHHFYQMIQIIMMYALTSLVTAFYIYVTIIASPAVILLILACTPYGQGDQFNQAHKAFPWIGMHTLILKSASNRTVRSNFDQMCVGLIIYFFILYIAYYSTILLLSNNFFQLPAQQGVPQIFFGYIAILQFMSLIFMRTRTFLKYFPICHTIIVMIFLLYCKESHFGYKLFLVLFLQFGGFALFSWMMYKLQIPAQTTWNRQLNFVPSINQPRAGLMPAFNLNWINGLPDEWAMLFPLVGRSKFSQKQLAYVDRNFQLLNEYMQQ